MEKLLSQEEIKEIARKERESQMELLGKEIVVLYQEVERDLKRFCDGDYLPRIQRAKENEDNFRPFGPEHVLKVKDTLDAIAGKMKELDALEGDVPPEN
jgi:hypothetical protein